MGVAKWRAWITKWRPQKVLRAVVLTTDRGTSREVEPVWKQGRVERMSEPSEDHRRHHGPWSSQWTVVQSVVLVPADNIEDSKFGKVQVKTTDVFMGRGPYDDPWSRPWCNFQWPSLKTHFWEAIREDHEGFHGPWIPWQVVVVAVKRPDNSVLVRLGLILNILFWITLGRFGRLFIILLFTTKKYNITLSFWFWDFDYCYQLDVRIQIIKLSKWLLSC